MARSLRSRLVIGAALWTVGLFAAAIALHTEVMTGNPELPRHLSRVVVFHTREIVTIAVVCLVFGLWQVRRGISAVDALRAALIALRQGRRRRIEGTFPAEVQPLVDDLNALLEQRERTLERALARAGDLAHGLKTPLAVLGQEAARAAAAGQGEMAAVVGEEVERMRRQVDYHLARARAAAAGAAPGAHCLVREAAEALVRALSRLHAERGLSLEIAVPADLAFRGQREDLDELLGNVLDNACKWAASRVRLTAEASSGDRLVLTAEDDGSGLDESMRDAVLRRGVRADEAAPGTGLGLAIVRDLVELYGGTIALDRSPLGGLRVTLSLPRAGGA